MKKHYQLLIIPLLYIECGATKGCFSVSIDAPHLGQGLCTISEYQCPQSLRLIYIVVLCQGGEPEEETDWGQEQREEEREAQKDGTHATDI